MARLSCVCGNTENMVCHRCFTDKTDEYDRKISVLERRIEDLERARV